MITNSNREYFVSVPACWGRSQ